jgi:hypothetical protein
LEKIRARRRTDAAGQDALVVDGVLHPGHEVVDIFRGRHLGGLLVVLVILPQVFELVRRLHGIARLGRAELCDGTV